MRQTVEDRFFAKVDVGDCWEWTASLTDGGYGQFFPGDGRRWRSHRWAWEHLVGPIPQGLELDHLCRNRKCCNPDHLEPVTRAENQRRGESPTSRNFAVTHCPWGHVYSGENLYVTSQGYRQCRACWKRKELKRKNHPKVSET